MSAQTTRIHAQLHYCYARGGRVSACQQTSTLIFRRLCMTVKTTNLLLYSVLLLWWLVWYSCDDVIQYFHRLHFFLLSWHDVCLFGQRFISYSAVFWNATAQNRVNRHAILLLYCIISESFVCLFAFRNSAIRMYDCVILCLSSIDDKIDSCVSSVCFCFLFTC